MSVELTTHADIENHMKSFLATERKEEKTTHFLAMLVLNGDTAVEETAQRLECLSPSDRKDLFQYHTNLENESAEDIFCQANQKVNVKLNKVPIQKFTKTSLEISKSDEKKKPQQNDKSWIPLLILATLGIGLACFGLAKFWQGRAVTKR